MKTEQKYTPLDIVTNDVYATLILLDRGTVHEELMMVTTEGQFVATPCAFASGESIWVDHQCLKDVTPWKAEQLLSSMGDCDDVCMIRVGDGDLPSPADARHILDTMNDPIPGKGTFKVVKEKL